MESMENRRVTRSMTTYRTCCVCKRPRLCFTPPSDETNTSTHRSAPYTVVPWLHTSKCMGTPKDVAKMSRNLSKNPLLLEKSRADGNTPLISAVKRGHENCVQFILKNRPNLEITNLANENALCSAWLKYKECDVSDKPKFYNIMKLLLYYGSDPNWSGTTHQTIHEKRLFKDIIVNGSINVIKLFLNYNIDLSLKSIKTIQETKNSFIQFGVLYNSGSVGTDIMKLLLEKGAELNFGRKNDLVVALEQCNILAVKYVCTYHGSPLIHGPTSRLHILSYRTIIQKALRGSLAEKIAIIELLYRLGANLWKNERPYRFESKEADDLYVATNKIRSQPLSLKSLSRIKVMHVMGKGYVKNIKKLEIPITLHEFLQFPLNSKKCSCD